MTDKISTYLGGPVFDGKTLLHDHAARFLNGRFDAIVARADAAPGGNVIDLKGDIVSPGYVDLQVNGGDGIMLNDDPSVDTLRRIAKAHRKLGATKILPTLITDTPEKTRAAIKATISAIEAGVEGIAGLHLEGPHLSVARKGAHDATLIRAMTEADLAALLEAAKALPVLKVTLAPENVTSDQVAALANAGVLVSLGHTDADYDTCMAYTNAGARCVTHLFNAMSQLGNRQPGLVGATLQSGALSAGLIADGIHVHTAAMRAALKAKNGPGKVFLVSDAMAVAGTDLPEFWLEGRHIRRQGNRLTLDDGTLAGADLDMTTAIRVLSQDVGVELGQALAAATSIPAALIGLDLGLDTSSPATEHGFIRIRSDLTNAQLITAD